MRATAQQPQRATYGVPVPYARHRPEQATLYGLVPQHVAGFINGGRRGFQVSVEPKILPQLVGAVCRVLCTFSLRFSMSPLRSILLSMSLLAWAVVPAAAQITPTMTPAAMPKPPVADKRNHVVKSPQGDRVDEYYWLRDDDTKTKRPEVMQYLEAENAYTQAMMAPLVPLQKQILSELRSRIVPNESTPPSYANGWWTWTEYTPGAEHPRLLGKRGGPADFDRLDRAALVVLIDQAERAKGKPFYEIGSWQLSPDGRLLAWTEDTVGRRGHVLRVRDLAAGRDMADAVEGTLEELAWANDNRTLFYVQQDPVLLQSGPVLRHRVGTPQSADVKVYEEADKSLFTGVQRSASGRYVMVNLGGGNTSEVRAIDAQRPTTPPRLVLARQQKVRFSADHWQGRWLFRTNEGALNFKLVSAPERTPAKRSHWRTLVSGSDSATLEGFAIFERGIALQQRVDAQQRIAVLDQRGVRPVETPPGSTATLAGRNDPRALYLRFSLTSMVLPQTTIDFNLASGQQAVRKVHHVPGFDAALYASERMWAPARDGKRIPVSLAWRRDKVERNGRAPILIDGYGAYGSSWDPLFSANALSLLDRGFVMAIAHVRGGAELGEAWFEDGRLMNKKNSFNDFVDATDAIVAAGWAAQDKVFARGGSAGGLLMAAVANQAGGRYRGMLVSVPFVDVLTTMLDETIPLTVNEYVEWGDPREAAAYTYMLSYSPYDNLRARPYPAMYVTTGLWDSQVQYYEPAKYVARMRALKTDNNPLLLETDMTSGHAGASGRFSRQERLSREFAFVVDLAGRP